MDRFEKVEGLIRWADDRVGMTNTPGLAGVILAGMAVAEAVITVGRLLEERLPAPMMKGPLQEDPALIIGRAILAQAPERATGVYIHSREGISWGFRTNREKAPEGYVWLKPEEGDDVR